MFQCQVSQAQDAMLHKPRPRRCHGMVGYGMELTNYRIYMGFIWDLLIWELWIYPLVSFFWFAMESEIGGQCVSLAHFCK
jgi:hypothetical protein